jgi:hypothetical protein
VSVILLHRIAEQRELLLLNALALKTQYRSVGIAEKSVVLQTIRGTISQTEFIPHLTGS